MQIEDLDQRVTLEQRSVARETAFGAEVVTWPALATVWANLVDQVNPKKGGDEVVAADIRTTQRRTHVTIRWRNDVTPDMRVQWPYRSRTFQITGMSEIGRREWLELTCEEYGV